MPDLAAAIETFATKLSAGDVSAVDRFIAPTYFVHTPTGDEPSATKVWGDVLRDLRGGLPDLALRVADFVKGDDDDQVRGRATLNGTHTASLWGVPATGAVVSWEVAFTARAVGDGFAVRLDGVGMPEVMPLLRQLELVQAPDEMDKPAPHAGSWMPDPLLRVLFTGRMADVRCDHLEHARVFDSDTTACEQCVASGDIWPALRLCMTCGFVGCCDTSKNTHMKRHAEETGHTLIRSLRNDEAWMWCYAHNAFFDGRQLAALRARAQEG